MSNPPPQLPRLILYCALASSLLLIVVYGPFDYPDTKSYIEAWDLNISHGRIDMFRTPAYPIFLAAVRAVVGAKLYFLATVCIQHLVFLGSVRCFYRLAVGLLASLRVSFGLTMLYALVPAITLWHNVVQTESFALSGLVILMYLTHRMHACAWAWLTAWCYGGLLLLLLMLRPAFVYLLPVLGLSWLIALVNRSVRKAACVGLGGVVAATLCLLGYMKAFEREYGVFAPTCVSTINQLINAQDYGIIDVDHSGFTQKGAFPAALDRIQASGLRNAHDELVASFRAQPVLWVTKTAERFYTARSCPALSAQVHGLGAFFDTFGIGLMTINLLLLVYAIVGVCWSIRRRAYPWLSACLFMAVASHYVVSVVGSYGDYARLLLPGLPLCILMVGQLCSLVGGRTTLAETLK